ncbi:hypothetical protein AB0N89_01375 [Amycolatopsis sp. NPDC089917]|uniref:hypothetical protein n=1 Tax=Amycolatopsis sp. NPDC089917 TaxID=3155187 RepID=UPI003425F3B2
MTQRVVLGASAVLFCLLALMTHLMVDIHDRAFPVGLNPSSLVNLDFSEATLKDDAATSALRSWDSRAGLGLLKETADLDGDLRGKVFIALNDSSTLPAVVEWYGDEPGAKVVESAALDHVLPSGTYLVTGRTDQLSEVIDDLRGHQVSVTRTDPTLFEDLSGLYFLQSLTIALVTGCVLLVTLVLYWFAAKSRGRALRVLTGTPIARIQLVDVTRFLFLLTLAWAATTATAVLVVGLWKGWSYTGLFASRMGALGAMVLLLVIVAAGVISAMSAPSPESIARRKPASLGVRRAAGGIKVIAFGFALLAIGPAWAGIATANESAAELGQWDKLANQVRTTFQGTSEDDFQRLMPPFGAVVRTAASSNTAALSYLTTDQPGVPDATQWAAALGRWSSFALVNQRWLDLMRPEGGKVPLTEVPAAAVPPRFLAALTLQVEVWKRSPEPASTVMDGFRYLTPDGGPVPFAAPGGELEFHDDTLVIVVPDLWKTFNDSFLVSTASSGNLLFTGLGPTQELIAAQHIDKEIKVRYAAADGILRAQFAAYDAWLGVVSVIGLAVALMVAAAISAYLSALLEARNDFARRLAGYAWPKVLARRLVPEIVTGTILAVLIALVQAEHAPVVLVATVLLLGSAPVAHVFAARRAFADVSARRL